MWPCSALELLCSARRSFVLFGRMEAFLRTVDDVVPANLEVIVQGLAKAGFHSPEHLDQADAAEAIEAFPQEGDSRLLPAGKAFVRRAIAKASARGSVVAQQPGAAGQPSRSDRLDELFGSEVSAESVAAALSAKPAMVDVQDALAKIQCTTLPPAMVPELAVWQALVADSEAAKKRGRPAFTYVDFTAKPMAPPWLPADALNGRTAAEPKALQRARGPALPLLYEIGHGFSSQASAELFL